MPRRRRERRRGPKPAAPPPARDDALTARIRAAEGQGVDEETRDALVAMVVVRAIDRARSLISVEGGGLALRRALGAAEKPMAALVERHLTRQRKARRKKA